VRYRLVAIFLILLEAAACGRAVPPSRPAPYGILYYRERSAPPNQWSRVDWSGHLLAAIQVPSGFQPSPDGSRLLIEGSADFTVLDKTGRPIAGPFESGIVRDVAWSSEGAHICAIDDVPEWGSRLHSLRVGYAGTGLVDVMNIDATSAEPGLAACSVERNRVVTVDTVHEHDQLLHPSHTWVASRVRVVDIQSRAIVFERHYPVGDPKTEVIARASLQAGTLAEVRASGTTIVDIPSGATLGTFAGWTGLGLSANGALIALRREVAGGTATPGSRMWESRVAAVSTGATIWSSIGPYVLQATVPNPTQGDSLMLAGTGGGLSDLIVVDGDGSSHVLAKDVFYLPPCPCFGRSAG